MEKASNLCKDFTAAYIRSQIRDLENALFHIEASDKMEDDYITDTLRKVEGSINKLRKLYAA